MSASFVVAAFVAAVLLVYWRLVLLVLAACLLALLLLGLGVVNEATSAVSVPSVVVGQPGPH